MAGPPSLRALHRSHLARSPSLPSSQPSSAEQRTASSRVGPSGHTPSRESALAGGAQLQAVRGQSLATASHLQSAQHPRPLLRGGDVGREALTVARQAGPAAAAVGSRSPAAPAPPPRAESPRPTSRRPELLHLCACARCCRLQAPRPPQPPPQPPRAHATPQPGPCFACARTRAHTSTPHTERSSRPLYGHRIATPGLPWSPLHAVLHCRWPVTVVLSLMLLVLPYPVFGSAAVTSLPSPAPTLLLRGSQRLKSTRLCLGVAQ